MIGIPLSKGLFKCAVTSDRKWPILIHFDSLHLLWPHQRQVLFSVRFTPSGDFYAVYHLISRPFGK